MKRRRSGNVGAAFKPPRKKTRVTAPAKSLRFQANTVRSGAELKNIDQDHSAAGTATSPAAASTWVPAPAAATLLNGLAQGTSANTRIGRKVQIKSVDIVWDASLAATTTQGCVLRFKVIYDKQANGAAPAVLDIFQANTFYSANNLDNSDRFITIGEWMSEPLATNGNWTSSGRKHFKVGLEMIFNAGNAGTVADIQTGSIYLLVSQNGEAATAAPTFKYYSRVKFTDN